jgi:glycosyltransferase involved in cell wall biosynthesis
VQFTGGARVIYEHTRELLRRGHEVTIVMPRLEPGAPWTREGRDRLRMWLVETFLVRSREAIDYYGIGERIRFVPALDARYFPDGDILLANAWMTVHPVAAAPARCGRPVHFLQHYDVFHPGEEEVVDATWRLPIEKIAISTWLKELARERFGAAVWGPVPNGVNFDLFHDRGRTENEPPVVGMVYELQPWKGNEDGFEAIRLARERVPGLRLLAFGRYRLRHPLGTGDRYVRNPTQPGIGDLYRACDLFLSPSWAEGWGLPATEAMACGCAVVTTDVGGVPDYAIAGVTALTAPPHAPRALAEALVRLAEDRALRKQVAAAGKEHIARFTWPSATAGLEQVLERILSGERARFPEEAAR